MILPPVTEVISCEIAYCRCIVDLGCAYYYVGSVLGSIVRCTYCICMSSYTQDIRVALFYLLYTLISELSNVLLYTDRKSKMNVPISGNSQHNYVVRNYLKHSEVQMYLFIIIFKRGLYH